MAISYLATLLVLANTFVAPISAAKSAGCGKPLPAAQSPAGGDSHQVNFKTSDGTDRTYLIHIPSNYDINTAVPLIFSFHGHSKNSAEQEELSQFSNEASNYNPNGIAVYPQGTKNAKGVTQWQGDPDAQDNLNDIGFTQDMIKHFKDRYCIDTNRIYAAGKSNGGGFTNLLACDSTMSKQIAAFAPVSGAYYIPVASEADCKPMTISIPCSPGRNPLPIIEFHGLKDNTIHYGGDFRKKACLPTIPHWVREWSKREGFGLSNKTTQLYGNQVQKYEYGGDSGKLGIVTHYLDDKLNHSWPSTKPNDDNPAGTVYDATPIIMDFFNKYTL